MKKSIKTILRGVGQVMFQNNALTGLFFLLGIFYNSRTMGMGAIFGNFISTLTANLFKYNKEDIENGLYGFNGTLVGIAIYFYFGLNLVSIIAVIIGSIISTIIMHEMSKRIKAFTAPFVVSTWIVIFLIWLFKMIPFINLTIFKNNSLNLFQSVSVGFGQVMFQVSIFTGILFIIGILINSKKSALYAIYGSVLSVLVALLLFLNISMINIGIFSYNAILCSIALGDNQNKKDYLYILIAVILSVIVTYLFGKLGIIALTAPFVISTWFVLFIKNKKLSL